VKRTIVTCADSNIYNTLLVSFIGSLKENAKFTGEIAIIDYGLHPLEVARLKELGINVVPALDTSRPIISDRFTSLSALFKEGLIAEWDCDVFFCDSVDDVFEYAEPGKLTCTFDATYQYFLSACVHPDYQPKIKKILDQVVGINGGHVLQGGFIIGDNKALSRLSTLQDRLIKYKIGYDVFGIDMVALNLLQHFQPDSIKTCGIEYNCLPDWNLYKQGDDFYADQGEVKLKAIHVSSPHRNKFYSFYSHYPEIYREYQNKFSLR